MSITNKTCVKAKAIHPLRRGRGLVALVVNYKEGATDEEGVCIGHYPFIYKYS